MHHEEWMEWGMGFGWGGLILWTVIIFLLVGVLRALSRKPTKRR